MWGWKWWLMPMPLLAILLLWAGILKTEEFERCEHCLASRFHDRAFWCGMNYSTTEYPWRNSTRTEVCEALGRPCSHDLRTRFLRKRMWGGIYCACPCINGTTSLSSGTWSTPEGHAAIKRVAEKDPEFADEFARRCLVMKDQEFFKEIAERIDAELKQNAP